MESNYIGYKLEYGENIEGLGKRFEVLSLDKSTGKWQIWGLCCTSEELIEITDKIKEILSQK